MYCLRSSEEKLARHWVQPPQFNNQSIKHLINHNLFKNFLKIDGGKHRQDKTRQDKTRQDKTRHL